MVSSGHRIYTRRRIPENVSAGQGQNDGMVWRNPSSPLLRGIVKIESCDWQYSVVAASGLGGENQKEKKGGTTLIDKKNAGGKQREMVNLN